MATTIRRLRRTDQSSDHLLLNIATRGPEDLDLKLIGTDFAELYHGRVDEATIKTLQASSFTGNLDEWKSILAFALLHRKPEGPLPEFLQGLEAVASVSGKTATITLRRNIGGITQRLGTIKLEEDSEREEINGLHWTDSAVATSDDLRAEIDDLQTSLSDQQKELFRLRSELDRLVKAKNEHDDELLSKFAALMNAKKLKIRDQQRLLSGAQIGSEATGEAEGAIPLAGRTSRRVAASRGGKRKAKGSPPAVEDDVTDDEDQQMLHDDEDDRQRQETPGTEEDDENDVESVAERMDLDTSAARHESTLASRGKAVATAPTPPATSMTDDEDDTEEEL